MEAMVYVILGLSILGVEMIRSRKAVKFDALSVFGAAFFLFFVFAPLNVIYFGLNAVRQPYVYERWGHGDVLTALILMMTYVVFVCGYYRPSAPHTPGTPKTSLMFSDNSSDLKVVLLVFAFTALGTAALAYQISLAGGLLESLKYAPLVRTGDYKLEGGALFFRQFSSFLATAFIVTFALILDAADPRKVRVLWVLLILTGFGFVFSALVTFGRRDFIYPIIISLVVWMSAGKYKRYGVLAWLLILISIWFLCQYLLIPSLNEVSVARSEAVASEKAKESARYFLRDNYFATIQGLADSFMHFVAAENAQLWQFGFLTDIQELPLHLLPSQVLGFDRPPGMLGDTTEFIRGYALDQGKTGEEPLGLHGYLLVNFSHIGLLALFMLSGKACRFLDDKFISQQGFSALWFVVYLFIIFGALVYFREGAIVFVVKQHISWWLAVLFLTWRAKRRIA